MSKSRGQYSDECRISRICSHRLPAARLRDLGQDRIAHGAERLRDQRRADQPRRIARAERDQAPAPALRHRQRQQIAHQVDDVLQIVGKADARRWHRRTPSRSPPRSARPAGRCGCEIGNISTAAPTPRPRRHWLRSARAARRLRSRGRRSARHTAPNATRSIASDI